MQTTLPQSSPVVETNGFARSIPGQILAGLAATVVVAAAAHVSIPLWFTPVPLTLQPLAVLAVGLTLGPIAGFFAMLAYLAEGALGLPVFSPTGLGGVAQILGPTGGFLMAYPFVAAIVGGVARLRGLRTFRFGAAALACLVAMLVLFSAGAGWLAFTLHLSVHTAWSKAVAPFLLNAVLDLLVASGVYAGLRRNQVN